MICIQRVFHAEITKGPANRRNELMSYETSMASRGFRFKARYIGWNQFLVFDGFSFYPLAFLFRVSSFFPFFSAGASLSRIESIYVKSIYGSISASVESYSRRVIANPNSSKNRHRKVTLPARSTSGSRPPVPSPSCTPGRPEVRNVSLWGCNWYSTHPIPATYIYITFD